MYTLYSHQQVAKRNILRSWQRRMAVLYISPTGSGKTVIFLDTLNSVLSAGKRAIIAAPKTKVVTQTIEVMQKHYPHISCGGLGGGLYELDKQLTIGTAKSIANNIDRIFSHGQVEYLVFDEAHYLGATTMQYIKIRAMRQNKSIHILGVTATPDRHDGFDLMQLFDMRYEIDRSELGKPLATAIYIDSDITTPEQAIWTYKKYADGRRTIVFCRTQDQAYYWHRYFKAAGYDTGVVDGTTNDFMRRRVEANAQIIFNVDVYTEGADIALISCVIIAKSAQTKSRTRYMQRIGRGLRPDTDDCIIIGRNKRWQAKEETSKPKRPSVGYARPIRTQGNTEKSSRRKRHERTWRTGANDMLDLIKKISKLFNPKGNKIMTKSTNGLQGSGLLTTGKQEDIIADYNEAIQQLYDAFIARNNGTKPNTISVPNEYKHMFTLISNRLNLRVEGGQPKGFALIDLVEEKIQPSRPKLVITPVEDSDEPVGKPVDDDTNTSGDEAELPLDGNPILLVDKDGNNLSSNLMAVSFERKGTKGGGVLRVWFHDGDGDLCYAYKSSYQEYISLVTAKSIGAYFNKTLRNRKFKKETLELESPYIEVLEEEDDDDSVVVGEPEVSVEPPVYETATDSGLPAFRVGVMGDAEQDYLNAITKGSKLCKSHPMNPHQPTHVALPDDTPEEVIAFLQENDVLIADWHANDDEVWVGTIVMVEEEEELNFSF